MFQKVTNFVSKIAEIRHFQNASCILATINYAPVEILQQNFVELRGGGYPSRRRHPPDGI
jgi:hypothetical protein